MTTFGTGPFYVEFTRLMQGDTFRAKPEEVPETEKPGNCPECGEPNDDGEDGICFGCRMENAE
jgi:NMD protein affecting ribosome stability and mRNA decay